MSTLFKPEQHFLSNGIPVILQNYDSAVSATYWWIKTGSCDENPKEAGFAHFLEHMLFKDAAAKETGKASTGQMASAIESLGGDINAYTSFDQTVYHVTSAAHHWEKVIDNFGVMAKPQKFLKSDFEREREVILEELKKNEDSPSRQLFQGIFSGTFAKHPYGRPVIGFVKTLKAAKVTDLDAFYRRNYVSEKMGLILVGPFDETRKKRIFALLEKHYGSKVIKKREAQPHKRALEPALRKKPNFLLKTFDVKTPTVAFAFRVPELRHDDVPALDLLAGVLGMGEMSRLYQKIFYGASLATDVSGGLYVPNDPGMMYFQAEVENSEKIEPVAIEMFKELQRIKEEGPTDEELKRVLVNSESEKLYSTQTADGMASRLGFLRFVMGDLSFDQVYLDDLRSVDAQKVQEVAARYFAPERMTGVALLPKNEAKYDFKKIEKIALEMLKAPSAFESKAGSSKKGTGVTAKKEVEFFETASGIRVSYRENPQSQVMSVYAAAKGGLRLELPHWGASHLMSLTWTKGTKDHNSSQIASLIEGHAAGLDGFSGRNTVGMQLTGLSRDWQKLSALFSEVLVEPSFPEVEVGHSRRVAEESVKGIDDHSAQLCSKLFLETLFESHPYGKLTTGSLETLRAIDSNRLKELHASWIKPEKMAIAVSGRVKRGEFDAWLKELDSRLQKNKSQGTPQTEPAPEPDLKAPRWVEKKLGREQLHIIVGGLGLTMKSEERYALQLLSTLLGGQSGRLFIELREKKSLAYTVSPVSFEGMERGYVGTYIACSPQKKDEALAGIRQVLETLSLKGPTSAEMRRAKEFFLGRRAMDLQSDSSLATHDGLERVYDMPHFDQAKLIQRVESISPKQVQEVCRSLLVDAPMVTSIVG